MNTKEKIGLAMLAMLPVSVIIHATIIFVGRLGVVGFVPMIMVAWVMIGVVLLNSFD